MELELHYGDIENTINNKLNVNEELRLQYRQIKIIYENTINNKLNVNELRLQYRLIKMNFNI